LWQFAADNFATRGLWTDAANSNRHTLQMLSRKLDKM
jgi:hypothetical protein